MEEQVQAYRLRIANGIGVASVYKRRWPLYFRFFIKIVQIKPESEELVHTSKRFFTITRTISPNPT